VYGRVTENQPNSSIAHPATNLTADALNPAQTVFPGSRPSLTTDSFATVAIKGIPASMLIS
jgi:hypothetical protein